MLTFKTASYDLGMLKTNVLRFLVTVSCKSNIPLLIEFIYTLIYCQMQYFILLCAIMHSVFTTLSPFMMLINHLKEINICDKNLCAIYHHEINKSWLNLIIFLLFVLTPQFYTADMLKVAILRF